MRNIGVLRENNLHLVVHPVYSLLYPKIGLAWTMVSPIEQAAEQKKKGTFLAIKL